MSRPRRWTPELQARAEQLQAQGVLRTEIAAAIGVDESTVRYWLDSGQADRRRQAATARAALRKAALRQLEAAG
jgi:transposase-like protein